MSLNAQWWLRPAHKEYDENDKWGYVNTSGKVQIPFKYTSVGKFSCGLAPVMLDGKWGYINKTGKIVIPCQFGYDYDFDRGIAQVWDNGKECFINDSGRIIVRTPADAVTF